MQVEWGGRVDNTKNIWGLTGLILNGVQLCLDAATLVALNVRMTGLSQKTYKENKQVMRASHNV